ncbi:dTDP-4-dehydrorhamnose 3,5-epimerase [Hymenobacter siberiensis]|jgi:dTDP-4-dehydrorhamnose 3,5-epimerase|uniref:dTDP-4-dehydrorhamnose 3,5-epimerase n=1 Tax=Hymenobacter siberiensis TaxID=2848396 RepID=UPI001C1E06FE|nr:dTDP-4-dehydrorhamnose 3,5-epimerase [Hymenobacter siberiensis]MBU6119407.1 dTDP-4-dehydrorhamnose 3,5-epimerase [Hymenobacter siberiensis]
MEVKKFPLAGLIEFTPRVFADDRGVFFETFCERLMAEAGADAQWVQDNQSNSKKGVLRGLHFQRPPHAQAKLVRVGQGRAFDVAVDLRQDSPTYGQHQMVELTAHKANMLYIPAGFAHGFMALEDNTIFIYKCSDYYAPATEGGLRWDDADLGINWGTEVHPLVSGKDNELPAFKDFVSPF